MVNHISELDTESKADWVNVAAARGVANPIALQKTTSTVYNNSDGHCTLSCDTRIGLC